jgi:hypothetical protein
MHAQRTSWRQVTREQLGRHGLEHLSESPSLRQRGRAPAEQLGRQVIGQHIGVACASTSAGLKIDSGTD